MGQGRSPSCSQIAGHLQLGFGQRPQRCTPPFGGESQVFRTVQQNWPRLYVFLQQTWNVLLGKHMYCNFQLIANKYTSKTSKHTDIFSTKAPLTLKMIFLFPRWDMLLPWREIEFHETNSEHISGWWLNHPSEKYAPQNGFVFPNFRGENKKSLKPPPTLSILTPQKCLFWEPRPLRDTGSFTPPLEGPWKSLG